MKYQKFLMVMVVSGFLFAVPLFHANAALINADGILGQSSYTASSTPTTPTAQSLSSPGSTALDPVNHRLFVVDSNNTRVLMYQLDANDNIATATATYVFGQADFVTKGIHAGMQFNGFGGPPFSVAYDPGTDLLFVSDVTNDRVMIFDATPATLTANGVNENAEYLIGQTSFTAGIGASTTQNGLSTPHGLTVDPVNHRLFVMDSGNNRVMVFDVSAATLAANPLGENAEYVLGQANFTTPTAATTQSGLSNPFGGAYDSVNSRLFVSDVANDRVITFNVSPSTFASAQPGFGTAENASYVFGQTSFTASSTATTTQSGFATPQGLAYDSAQDRLFVGDALNTRVMIFDATPATLTANGLGENAENVIGQSDSVSKVSSVTQNGFSGNTRVSTYDPTDNTIFVTNLAANRVLQIPMIHITTASVPSGVIGISYSQTVTTTSTQGSSQSFSLYSGSLPTGLTLNTSTGAITGDPIVGGTSTFTIEADDTFTTGNFFDRVAYSLTVLDPGTISASGVLGQPNFTTNTLTDPPTDGTDFHLPSHLAIDLINHRLFLADELNNRILVFALDGNNNIATTTPYYVFGQPDFVSDTPHSGIAPPITANGFYGLHEIVYDSANQRLFASDQGNHRVLVFDASPTALATNGFDENAYAVIGQASLTSNASVATQAGLGGTRGIEYDAVNQRLFVADPNNNRVTIYDVSPAALTLHPTADPALYVLGQSDFTSGTGSVTQTGMDDPSAILFDPANERLFVAEFGLTPSPPIDNRVTVFNVDPAYLATERPGFGTAEPAYYVFGQPDFTSTAQALTQSGMDTPRGLAYDAATDRLFVSDSRNSRILVFNATPATLVANGLGENAENVIGQSDFTSAVVAVSQKGFSGEPRGITYNPTYNELYVVDGQNHRVLEFPMIHITTSSFSAGTTGVGYSQALTVVDAQGTSQSFSLESGSLPTGLSLNTSTGAITGTPTATGTSTFTIEADDTFSTGNFLDRATYSLTVSAPISTSTSTAAVRSGGAYVSPVTPSALGGATLDFTIDGGAKTTSNSTLTIAMNADPKTITG